VGKCPIAQHDAMDTINFFAEYDVKSQSSETDKIKGDILNIRNLSVYNTNRENIISNLRQVAEAYKNWIENERKSANGNELGLKNIAKCEQFMQN
jgi:hypothetical protein